MSRPECGWTHDDGKRTAHWSGSDGWDRGDPAVLAVEIARLRRSCHRLIWLNPLLGNAEYQPLTRGMQAALPHVEFMHAYGMTETAATVCCNGPANHGPAARASGLVRSVGRAGYGSLVRIAGEDGED